MHGRVNLAIHVLRTRGANNVTSAWSSEGPPTLRQ
jgi:hypothetical protein